VLEIIFCESAMERECCEIYGRAILSSALRASIVSHAAINNCDCLIWRLEQIPRQMPTQKVKSHSYFINTCLLWRKNRTNWQMVQGQGRPAFCGQFVDKRNWFGSINLCSIDFSINFWSMPTGLKFCLWQLRWEVNLHQEIYRFDVSPFFKMLIAIWLNVSVTRLVMRVRSTLSGRRIEICRSGWHSKLV